MVTLLELDVSNDMTYIVWTKAIVTHGRKRTRRLTIDKVKVQWSEALVTSFGKRNPRWETIILNYFFKGTFFFKNLWISYV